MSHYHLPWLAILSLVFNINSALSITFSSQKSRRNSVILVHHYATNLKKGYRTLRRGWGGCVSRCKRAQSNKCANRRVHLSATLGRARKRRQCNVKSQPAKLCMSHQHAWWTWLTTCRDGTWKRAHANRIMFPRVFSSHRSLCFMQRPHFARISTTNIPKARYTNRIYITGLITSESAEIVMSTSRFCR